MTPKVLAPMEVLGDLRASCQVGVIYFKKFIIFSRKIHWHLTNPWCFPNLTLENTLNPFFELEEKSSYLKQDGIHSQRPMAPPRRFLYLRETKSWRCKKKEEKKKKKSV